MLGWMLYCALLAACAAAAALPLERIARHAARPTRWVWALALAVSVLVSEIARVREVGILSVILPRAAAAPWLRAPAVTFAQAFHALGCWDARLTIAAWGATALVAGWFILSFARLLLRRRTWHADIVDGHAVLVSDADGPAVFGIGRGTIVLPRWALAVGDRARALMLAHELEHQRSGDTRLLVLSLGAILLQPWNPAVWWLARRLRLAIEVDCDARVLDRGADLHSYGLVLLEACSRDGSAPLPAPALSTPPSWLEQRIRAMCDRGVDRVRVGWRAAVVVLAVSAAALLPEPAGLHCALKALGFPVGQPGIHPN
ncbi:MAG TPA: M56 family metallopeptidase [Gemmatimonadales bacterium]|nr:M56 family metallopeptidase [Gemmatimonadales bacterium]